MTSCALELASKNYSVCFFQLPKHAGPKKATIAKGKILQTHQGRAYID